MEDRSGGVTEYIGRMLTLGDRETDSPEKKLKHKFMLAMGLLMSLGGIMWGGICLYYGLALPALIPLGYVVLTIFNIAFFGLTKSFAVSKRVQVLASLLLPFLFQWSLGGFAVSGAVMIWSVLALFGGATFVETRECVSWLVLFVLLTLFSGMAEPHLAGYAAIGAENSVMFFLINISIVTIIAFGLNLYFIHSGELARAALVEAEKQTGLLAVKLAKYLSPQVYKSIFSGTKEVVLESYRKKLTVFFSDIKDFTATTEEMESEALTRLLNEYLDEMSKIALHSGGTIDKYIGDAIMIFFGDPESRGEKEDALACVKMALEMKSKMRQLRKKWLDEGITYPLQIRMGINTGFCTVGNFGSEDRMDYTIVGSQVNIASRLESAAKPDEILISHETQALVNDVIACRNLGEITVKGIAKPIIAYQVEGYIEEAGRLPVHEEIPGMSLSVDFGGLKDERRAREILESVLNRIGNSAGGLPEDSGRDGK